MKKISITKNNKLIAGFYEQLKDFLLILLGGFSAAFGIKGFLVSSHFIDGGVTGISMLLNNLFSFPIPISISLVIINLPFIVVGYRQLGHSFAYKSIFSILILSLCLAFIPYPDVTPDKLLTAVFGGFFIGAGIGLAMRGGAVLDGTDIAALLFSKHTRIIKVGDAILLLNIIIFVSAVFVLGVEPALYSILTYFTASKMIDFVVNGIEEYIGVTIVSSKSSEIRKMIIEKLSRGVTIFNGKSGYGKRGEVNQNLDIIYSVMTRLEIGSLQSNVDEIDSTAFIVYQSINDIKGGVVKKRPLH